MSLKDIHLVEEKSIGSSIVLELRGPEETAQLARRLSELVGAGDVLFLSGPIGAGKTLFARSLIQDKLRRAGQYEEVPSPTYTLVQTYNAGALVICHADLYRIDAQHEIAELGLEDAFEYSLCIVEWPEKLPDGFCRFTWKLDLAPTGNSEDLRRATVIASHPANFPHLAKLECSR